MSLFNPRILDASILDVTTTLNGTHKADVLLHALHHCSVQGGRTIIENAVQSLLQVPNLPSVDVASALLLRARTRLAAGYHTSAQQDLHSALTEDPGNQDAKAIIQSQPLQSQMLQVPDRTPRFSPEVWREIALFLPKRDLRSLLFVPNALSRIASQLLFREIYLHLTTTMRSGGTGGQSRHVQGGSGDEPNVTWHYQRSADILARILVDPQFAACVKSFGIYAVPDDTMQPLTFQVGMLMNALPKLKNLRKIHCSGNTELIDRMLQTIHAHNPRLEILSLDVADHAADIELPVFKHLTHIGISSVGENYSSIHAFLTQSRNNLRSLSIENPNWRVPVDAIPVQNLTHFEFIGCFSTDTQAFSHILANGHQLESFVLSGALECPLASLFFQYRTALPFLRQFSFTITKLRQNMADSGLCPAICEFLRERTQLRMYELVVPAGDAYRVGFDASTWGVLPALSNLRNLCITYPEDLSPALAGWLVPRSVRSFTLDLSTMPSGDMSAFMNNLRIGIPSTLRYFGAENTQARHVSNLAETVFPNVQVLRIDHRVWTVKRSEEDGPSLKFHRWPRRQVQYHAVEWLESLDCADTVWNCGGGLHRW